MARGRLVVIEGIDGSGKTTQLKLLFKYLKQQGEAFEVIGFPRYDKFFGKMVGMILKGKLGGINLSPYLTSLPFALDRLMAKGQITRWLEQGKLVVADRYTPSSLAHQGARMEKGKQGRLINWLGWLEYRLFGLPKADLVIYLSMPAEKAQELMMKRKKKIYIKGRDVFEKNLEHQRKTREVYLKLTEEKKHWKIVNCVDKHGRIYSPNEIHQKIITAID